MGFVESKIAMVRGDFLPYSKLAEPSHFKKSSYNNQLQGKELWETMAIGLVSNYVILST